MKKIFVNKIAVLPICLLAVMLTISSCRKDSDGSPSVKPGNPVSSGIAPDSAANGTLLTLSGTGLGDMRSIVFDNKNIPAAFQTTLNTETAIIFRVPDTAWGGPQNIVFTNSQGKKLTVPFKVLAYPNITAAFPMDFQAGSVVTLTGTNLLDVTKVVIKGTTDEATIVSQTRSQLVIAMPSTTASRGFLNITNATGTITTTQEFVSVDNATGIFLDDFVNNAQSWSWGGTYDPSTDDAITGAKSLKAAYDPTGTWGGLQIGMGSELTLPAGSKYFTFWAKGSDVDKQVTLTVKGNNWTTVNTMVITVPAGKWTYFREDMSTFLPGVNSISLILFQIHDSGKTIYYDNIMFVK